MSAANPKRTLGDPDFPHRKFVMKFRRHAQACAPPLPYSPGLVPGEEGGGANVNMGRGVSVRSRNLAYLRIPGAIRALGLQTRGLSTYPRKFVVKYFEGMAQPLRTMRAQCAVPTGAGSPSGTGADGLLASLWSFRTSRDISMQVRSSV